MTPRPTPEWTLPDLGDEHCDQARLIPAPGMAWVAGNQVIQASRQIVAFKSDERVAQQRSAAVVAYLPPPADEELGALLPADGIVVVPTTLLGQ